MTPSVSVVIPCFNAAPFVGATLRSVFAQVGVDLEVVVVDDGSTDGSAALIARDFPAVRLFQQKNRGVAAARNLGIQHSRHDWVAFLDADDIWLPGKLQSQLQLLCEHPEARMAYAAWEVWTSTASEPSVDFLAEVARHAGDSARWNGPSGWIYPDLLLDCVVWTSTAVLHRSLLAELKGFDEERRIGEDYDLWLRASRVTPILRVARPYALYRKHQSSVTRGAAEANHRGEVIANALRQWGYSSPDGRSARPADVSRGLAGSWSDFAWTHLYAGNAGRAFRAAFKAVWLDFRCTSGWIVLLKAAFSPVPRSPRAWQVRLSESAPA
jgi:glycosyltransferase involved in cell wall biosynthesis